MSKGKTVELENRLSDSMLERGRLNERIVDLEKEIAKLKEERNSLDKALSNSNIMKDALIGEKNDLYFKLATIRKQVEDMKEGVENAGYDNPVDGAYHMALEDVIDVLEGGEEIKKVFDSVNFCPDCKKRREECKCCLS